MPGLKTQGFLTKSRHAVSLLPTGVLFSASATLPEILTVLRLSLSPFPSFSYN